MKFIKTSILTGKTRTKSMPVSPRQYALWRSGVYIQDAMPNLTPDEREFIMTGITPDEWEMLEDD